MRLIKRGDPLFPVVFDEAEPVDDYKTQVRPHILGMYAILERLGGISLGAQQVGIARRFFIWRDHQNGTKFFSIVVNPRIVFRTSASGPVKEADLCDPGRVCVVERAFGIKVDYTDGAGNEIEQRFFTGLHAQVFIHEIERQNGVSIFRAVLESDKPPEAPAEKVDLERASHTLLFPKKQEKP